MRRLLATLTTIVVLGGGVRLALERWHPPLRRIVCTGVTELTAADVGRWLAHHAPSSLADVDPRRLRRELLAAVPLADVRIERRWPDRLDVHVEERSPYATLLTEEGALVLVDRSGARVSWREDPTVGLWDRPIVRGCPVPEAGPAARRCIGTAVGYLMWLDAAAPQWLESLSEIRVLEDRSIVVYLQDGTEIDFGRPPYGPRLAALRQAWRVLRRHRIDPAVVRIEAGRVVVRPRNAEYRRAPRRSA